MMDTFLFVSAWLNAILLVTAIVYGIKFFKVCDELDESRQDCRIMTDHYIRATSIVKDYENLCSGIDELVVSIDSGRVLILGCKGSVPGRRVIVKEFAFDANDPEDKDFAVRNAFELIEEIKKA